MLKLSWELCAGLRRISDTSQTARPNLADTGQRLCVICLSEALHAWSLERMIGQQLLPDSPLDRKTWICDIVFRGFSTP